MALPLSAAERKKAEANDNTFVVKPSLQERFPVSTVKEIIRSTLKEKLSDAKYATEGTKELADLIKTKLKALGLPRYKFIVHVTIGESKGQGFRMATRCLWESASDDMATESYQNDSIFAVAVAYGVYVN